MNYLNSFVELSKFPFLIKVLLDLYNLKIKEAVSLIVISGRKSSGKSTLKRFMINVIESKGSRAEYILAEELLSANTRMIRTNISGLSGYACHARVNIFTDESINKLHMLINEGVTYKRSYYGFQTFQNPATLILDIDGNYESKLGNGATFNVDPNFKREPIIFYLPYQKAYRINETEIIKGCEREFKMITSFLEIKSMWIRSKFLVENVEIIFNGYKDIFTHLSAILVESIYVSSLCNFYTVKMLCEKQFAV
jgi:energy-coupling factor transporter ATP-binding protein EcfA2